jgi:hypothetical protein
MARLEIDPLERELFQSAASGDVKALAILAHVARQPKSYAQAVPTADATAAAEAFARLAAVNGGADEWLLLADVLIERSGLLGDRAHASRLMAEASDWQRAALDAGEEAAALPLAVTLTLLADDGDEAAAIDLNKLMEGLGPVKAPEVSRTIAEVLNNTGAPAA